MATAKKAPAKKAPAKKAACRRRRLLPRRLLPRRLPAAKKAPAKKAPAKKAACRRRRLLPRRLLPRRLLPRRLPCRRRRPRLATRSLPPRPRSSRPSQAKSTPTSQVPTAPEPSAARWRHRLLPGRLLPPRRRSQHPWSPRSSPSRASPRKASPTPRTSTPSSSRPIARPAARARRRQLIGQADRLEDEATQLIEEQEMGDVQFDDEGGEGDTMVVERERDLRSQRPGPPDRRRHRGCARAARRRHLRLLHRVRPPHLHASVWRPFRGPPCSWRRRSAGSVADDRAATSVRARHASVLRAHAGDRAGRGRRSTRSPSTGPSTRWPVEPPRHVIWTLQWNLTFNSGMAFSKGQGIGPDHRSDRCRRGRGRHLARCGRKRPARSSPSRPGS